MTNSPKKPFSRRSPVSVRLTEEERLRLEAEAGGLPLSRYIRIKLFHSDTPATPTLDGTRLSPHSRQKLLAQILASLGRSGIAASLAELTELARLGLLPDDGELPKLLTSAREEFAGLRIDLLRALGLRPKSGGRK
ncbi:MAG: hypothetical protein ABJL67_12220 [Sulfitobacter sp.]